jgi:hypothetical protein
MFIELLVPQLKWEYVLILKEYVHRSVLSIK